MFIPLCTLQLCTLSSLTIEGFFPQNEAIYTAITLRAWSITIALHCCLCKHTNTHWTSTNMICDVFPSWPLYHQDIHINILYNCICLQFLTPCLRGFQQSFNSVWVTVDKRFWLCSSSFQCQDCNNVVESSYIIHWPADFVSLPLISWIDLYPSRIAPYCWCYFKNSSY